MNQLITKMNVNTVNNNKQNYKINILINKTMYKIIRNAYVV